MLYNSLVAVCMYSLVASNVIWGLHLLPLLPADFRYLEFIHARCLRRILGKKSAYFSHISHKDIRDLANTCTMESIIRRKQLTHLGEILRLPEDHPDRLRCFQPQTDLRVRIPKGHTEKSAGHAPHGQRLSCHFVNQNGFSTVPQ